MINLLRTIFLAAVLVTALPLDLLASEGESDTVASEASDLPEFSILIAAPGHIIYELEGHAALRINGGRPETDDVVNWGLFDFSRPNFVYRFVKGETDYRIGLMPAEYFRMEYASEGRRVTELHLNLTDQEKVRLLDYIGNELSPANRVYRYNYVKDNCATRPVKAIEYALNQRLDSLASTCGKGDSFREIMRYYHRNYPWYQFGIDLALGNGIDKYIDSHDKLFAPVLIPELISGIVVNTDSTGVDRKIIDRVSLFSPGPEEGIADDPTPWYLTPLFVSWLILVIGGIITFSDQHRRRVSRWFDSILFTVYGVAGIVIAYLVFVSVHEATSPNWILAWLNPVSLVVGVGIWLKKAKKAVICAQFINFGGTFVLCIVGVTGLQVLNAAFWPLMLLDIMRSVSYLRLTRW